MTEPTADRLDDLRTEYANTGMVTSDGAVWLFSQIVVLREQVQRLKQPATERRLQISERRRDELREESLRRGQIKLDQAEKIRALEREIDGVRRQLGAEILRANEAEAELRRTTGKADQQPAASKDRTTTDHQPTGNLED
ncbi:hypothetical protein [Streptomyces sp. NBC_01373]|uniref:hypothetical protein n=1 Tax=Streptomyces sp. NBC_01373 TaxID=2903843 RepID=UPI00225265BD|nr:hypothetical protein [Streptomyces sp. NBC_01373]MCX4704394.1 hypothetical protein [Streptomyces sp. NBC_01373]MCX4707134.1 hypothetical protein [Streptomyces sp. NBC_01373]